MARPPTGIEPAQALKHLRPIHHEIMRRLLRGQSQVLISRDLLISQARLSVVCNSFVFKARFKQLQLLCDSEAIDAILDVETKVKMFIPEALDVLQGIIRNKKDTTPNLRRMAVKDWLDYSKEFRSREEDPYSSENMGTAEMIMQAFEEGSKLRKNIQEEVKEENKTIEAKVEEIDANPQDAEVITEKEVVIEEYENLEDEETLEEIIQDFKDTDLDFEESLKEEQEISRQTEASQSVDDIINSFAAIGVDPDLAKIEILNRKNDLKVLKESNEYKEMKELKARFKDIRTFDSETKEEEEDKE